MSNSSGTQYSPVFSDPRQVPCTSCVVLCVEILTLILTIIVMLVLFRISSSLHKWGSYFRSLVSSKGEIRFISRNEFPSFEGLIALFDRGDALVAAVCSAAIMQLAHEEVGKVLVSHSTYKSDPMRRLVRTLRFINISLRSNSAERLQVLAWLRKIHGGIKLFEFETNVFVLSSIAYGLARTYQLLGGVTDFELDALVVAIMNGGMATVLIPHDPSSGKLEVSVPNSFSEVTDFVSKKVKFSAADLEQFAFHTITGSRNGRGSRPAGALSSMAFMFLHPLSWIKAHIILHLIRDLTHGVCKAEGSNPRPGLALWTLQKLQPLLVQFHNTLCPKFLTFDGLFDLLSERDPSVGVVSNEVYEEIFGENAAAIKWRQRKDKSIRGDLPQLKAGFEAPPPQSISSRSLYSAVVEHVKCSYLRGQLVGRSVPQHLGVIMDGNRRFSKEHKLGDPVEGHQFGSRKLLDFMSWCFSAGIKNLTVWALSDDNLKRSKEELDSLFTLMTEHMREIFLSPIAVLDVRFRIVGDRSLLPEKLLHVIDLVENATSNNSTFNFQLAVGYGGRAEATRAMKRAVEFRARQKSLTIEDALSSVSPNDVSKHTYSAELGLPEMDAILRTSGENRLSGFALWETYGAEISFLDAKWPALSESNFLQSVVDLSSRNRRFGA